MSHDWKTLVHNAVRGALPRGTTASRPRWACVVEVLAIGSTRAKELCEEFEVDPDEELTGFTCENCPVLEDEE